MIAVLALAVACLALAVALIVAGTCCRRGPMAQPPRHAEPYRPRRDRHPHDPVIGDRPRSPRERWLYPDDDQGDGVDENGDDLPGLYR